MTAKPPASASPQKRIERAAAPKPQAKAGYPARELRLGTPTRDLRSRNDACIRSQSDVARIKSPAHSGTTAFALSPEKSAGTSNLPVCRSYLQRQPFTTLVCMGLRPLTSAAPNRPITR